MSQKGDPRARATTLVLLLVVLGFVSVGSSVSHPGGATAQGPSAPGFAIWAHPLGQPTATLSINPSQISQGQSIYVQTMVNGGTPPYSYTYSGLPSGCSGQNSAQFSCYPSGSGNFNVQVTVTDTNGNTSTSLSQSLTVTSSNNGNGNGNGNGSSNSISSVFSNIGGFLSLLVIFGIVGFATWVLLVIGVWIIAIVLLRRLPKRGEAPSPVAMGRCAACSSAIPTAAKFCPECGAATAPKRT